MNWSDVAWGVTATCGMFLSAQLAIQLYVLNLRRKEYELKRDAFDEERRERWEERERRFEASGKKT